jgi:arginine decarboxylase
MIRKRKEIRDKKDTFVNQSSTITRFSYFHHSFQAVPGVPGGNLRAYFLAYDEENYEYVPLDECLSIISWEEELVASSFVISNIHQDFQY